MTLPCLSVVSKSALDVDMMLVHWLEFKSKSLNKAPKRREHIKRTCQSDESLIRYLDPTPRILLSEETVSITAEHKLKRPRQRYSGP